ETTLSAAAALNSDAITVTSASAFPSSATLKIGTATVTCVSKSGNTFSGCTAHAAFTGTESVSYVFQPGSQVAVTFNPGTWTYGGGTAAVIVAANDTSFSGSGDTYVDLTYSRVGTGAPGTGTETATETADGFVKLDRTTMHA